MYRHKNKLQTELDFVEFRTPFSGKLRKDNRWVRLSECIPWSIFEDEYAKHFKSSDGNEAYPFRVALGSQIIRERLGLTDRETVAQIQENPYLQYFLGFSKYQDEEPFDASSMVYFRQRISADMVCRVNEYVCKGSRDTSDKDDENIPPGPRNSEPELHGKLLIDATCAPEDLRYPTDLSLLNEGREVTEKAIDQLWATHPLREKHRKPRTYRKKARSSFLLVIRQKKPKFSTLRKGIRRQLNYVRRNLGTIKALLGTGVSLTTLDERLYRKLLVTSEVYRQQKELLSTLGSKGRHIADRIVSIFKPHVRPIVRGKASAEVEFGAKLSVSVVDGKVYMDRLSWDAYNECNDLEKQAEAYKNRIGFYPESIHADNIYRTRYNHAWCKDRGIRLSGPKLGRPPEDANAARMEQRIQRQDEIDRIPVEGVFGVGKRRYSLSRIMAKLRETSEHSIALVFLVMNLEKILRDLLLSLLEMLYTIFMLGVHRIDIKITV